ncbi:FtsX-like permease family protein [Prolixibacteraceae bacterium Z1-6]|uniref:FtsX-like permease family protein n=1 Tax=Draconibacterium aestuarii TaxID=2998507 RepID=A0A9X3J5J5_9BACT|nr:FtsX-like permease family protein [Prolixibacteraceae bacterium Z1-6]
MKKIIQMAWRNIWRNRRRTIITAASIFFALFFAIIMRSFQLGTYGHMIHQVIESYSGYLQLQSPDYFDEPGLDNAFEYDQDLLNRINSNPGVKIAVPRVESFALASIGAKTKGVLVNGIDVEKEAELSNPQKNLVHYRFLSAVMDAVYAIPELTEDQKTNLKMYENASFSSLDKIGMNCGISDETILQKIGELTAFNGSYLQASDEGVLVSDRLSKFMQLNIGDTLVLMGTGYHGASAAGLFPVRGIIKIPSPELDNKLVYMSLPRAQEFFGMENMLTTLAINLNDKSTMSEVQQELTNQLDKNAYVVKNWQEFNPVLKQSIEGDNAGGIVFAAILYVIVFFGIFGTVLMMIAERKREFGVLIAIGMKKRLLMSIVLIEMFFIGTLGTVVGMLIVSPLIYLGNKFPIRLTGETAKMYEDMGYEAVMPMATFDAYFWWQAMIVLLMVVVASYFPLKSIRKLKVIKALRA